MKTIFIPLRMASMRGDYTSTDGEIASLHNLKVKLHDTSTDGEIASLHNLKVKLHDTSTDGEIASLHNLKVKLHDTSTDGEIASLHNLKVKLPEDSTLKSSEREITENYENLDEVESNNSIVASGLDSSRASSDNNSIVASGLDVSAGYSGKSDFILRLPDAPEVEFALKKSVLPGWHPHPDILPSQIVEAGENTESGWGKKAGELLTRFEADVEKHNLFFEPFFAISVLRMKDGSRILPSPPMLMIPGSGAPMVSGSDSFGSATMKMDVVSAVCSLQYRLRIPESLRTSKDIAYVDIMISRRTPLFKRKSIPKSVRRVTCDNYTHCIDPDGNAGEHPVSATRIVQGWQPEATSPAEVMHSMLESTDFQLVCELPFESLSSMTEFLDLPFNCGGLAMAEAHPTYRPDYAHLSEITASGKTIISGRTTLWDLTLVSPLPLPLSLSAPYTNMRNYSPRWVFHPDPSAKYYVYAEGDEVKRVPLRRHPLMYGSYYWCGMDGSDLSEKTTANTTDRESRTRRLPDGIFRSVRNSKFQFPDKLLMNLDVGRVIAVCRAFRASGLVATTSPTAYAFTTEGVFLLKEMDDGTFRDSGLICRHMLRDGNSFLVKGRSIEFVTDMGETVIIDGTTIKTKVNNYSPRSFNINNSGLAFAVVDENEECGFITRPLKLGSQLSWKQILSVKLEGSYNPSGCVVALYGSPDLRRWHKIAERSGGELGGLWSPLCRFFRLECKLNLKATETLEAILITYHLYGRDSSRLQRNANE